MLLIRINGFEWLSSSISITILALFLLLFRPICRERTFSFERESPFDSENKSSFPGSCFHPKWNITFHFTPAWVSFVIQFGERKLPSEIPTRLSSGFRLECWEIYVRNCSRNVSILIPFSSSFFTACKVLYFTAFSKMEWFITVWIGSYHFFAKIRYKRLQRYKALLRKSIPWNLRVLSLSSGKVCFTY